MSGIFDWLDGLFSPGGESGRTVCLQPVAMIRPSGDNVYAPSDHRPVREIPEAEFLDRYADHGHNMKVSFDADGVSNPQEVTAYGRGLDCWYIVSGGESEGE